ASLEQEAARFATQATSSYAALASELEKKVGWKVALEGKVVETKVDGYESSALFDVEKGCSQNPCLVQLRIGGRVAYAPAERLTAYGYVAGNTKAPRSRRTI